MHSRQRSHHARSRHQQEHPHEMDVLAQKARLDIPSRQNPNRKPAHLHPCSTPPQTSKTSLRCRHNRGSIQGRLRHSRFPTGGRHRDSQGYGRNRDIGNRSQQVQTPLGSKKIPRADSSSLRTVLPRSARWLRGLVPEPYSASMFHGNHRARTATQELGTGCLVNRPTSTSPPHVRTEYAQTTPEAVPRGCHEAGTAMYGHCDEAVKGAAPERKRQSRGEPGAAME